MWHQVVLWCVEVDQCLSSRGLLWLNFWKSFSHKFQFQIWNLQFSLHCTPSTISTKRQIILQLQIHSRENIFSAFYCLLKLGKSYNGILSTLPKEFSQICALASSLQRPFTNFPYWAAALHQIFSQLFVVDLQKQEKESWDTAVIPDICLFFYTSRF